MTGGGICIHPVYTETPVASASQHVTRVCDAACAFQLLLTIPPVLQGRGPRCGDSPGPLSPFSTNDGGDL